MHRFAMGYAITKRSEALLAICRQLEPLPTGANLGIVYATDHYAEELDLIVAELRGRTKVPHWVGTVGIGISAGTEEFFDTPAIAVLIGAFPAAGFRICATGSQSIGPVVRAHRSWYQGRTRHVVITHADPNNLHTPELLHALTTQLPGGFLSGGVVSSRSKPVHIANSPTTGAVSGVIFNELIPIYTALTQGCIPIGPPHQITACERNLVQGLDGRRALDVLREDVGELLARKLHKITGYIFIGFTIPEIPETTASNYTVRNLISFDRQQGWIAIGEWPHPGQALIFCRRDANQARDHLEQMLANLWQRLPRPPRAALYYSCMGRGERMFGAFGVEQRLIRSYLGDIPLIGLYANGEIFHHDIHGYAGVISVFL